VLGNERADAICIFSARILDHLIMLGHRGTLTLAPLLRIDTIESHVAAQGHNHSGEPRITDARYQRLVKSAIVVTLNRSPRGHRHASLER